MRVDIEHQTVSLSRRNLRALLAMLDEPTHVTKSIGKGTSQGMWMVRAEEDAFHYGGKKPGPMSDKIEAKL